MKAPYLKSIRWRSSHESEDRYPFNLPILQDPNFELKFLKPVTIIVGENGSGKSTLLESIAANAKFAQHGGSRNHQYDEDRHSPGKELEASLRYSWSKRIGSGFFFRAESFFNFSNYLDDKAGEWGAEVAYAPYGGKSLNHQSHGEAFLSFFASRPSMPALYILDEPEAALSPQRQLSLMEIVHSLTHQGNAQVIIATHSPLLSAMPFAELLCIEDSQLKERSYRSTEHFKLYKRFIEAPETLFRLMFSD